MGDRRAITTACVALATSLAVCPNAAAFADLTTLSSIGQDSFLQSAVTQKVKPGDDVAVPVSLPSTAVNVNAYKAKVAYDKDVFNNINVGSFACTSPWQSLKYNPSTGEFVVIAKQDPAKESKVASISFKVKESAKAGETTIGLSDVNMSAGTSDIEADPEGYAANVAASGVSGNSSSTGKPGSTAAENSSDSTRPSTSIGDVSANQDTEGNANDSVSNPEPSDGDVGTLANEEGTDLAETGSHTPALALALAAVICAMLAFVVFRKAYPGTGRQGAQAKALLSLVLAISLIGTVPISFASAAPSSSDYDVNSDGKVDESDIDLLENMLIGLADTTAKADINKDGKTTVTDLSILVRYRFGQAASTDTPSQPGNAQQPSTPSNTATPGSSTNTNTSTNPGSSSNTSTPANPSSSSNTNTAAAPNSPSVPDEPNTPSTPADPQQPDQPSNPDTPDNPATPPDEETEEFPQIIPSDIPVTYTEIQMRTDTMEARGIYGDHSQWPTGLEVSRDGKLMLMGTDCAGVYRSTDGGKNWEQASVGFNSRSSCSFAIDPHNSNHALVIGGSRSGDGLKFGGVYQTNDAGQTWQQVENVIRVWGNRFDWDCFEFDAGTYNASLGITTDVYLSTPWWRDVDVRSDAGQRDTKYSGFMKDGEHGLYKSTDGGTTYVQLSNDVLLTDGIVKFTDTGDLYVGNQYGLFRVNKQTGAIEASFFVNEDVNGFTTMKDWNGKDKQVLNFNMGVTGFDVVGNVLYVQTWDGIYTNDGSRPTTDADFTMIQDDGTYSKLWPQFITVSKTNPNYMITTARRALTFYYNNYAYYSHDGGKHWEMCNWDAESMFSEPEAWNAIERMIAFDPFDPNIVTMNGNGTITQSTDGGAMFVQTNGISNLMAGGHITLNRNNPDIITLGAQDFTGVMSTNGGRTWTQLRASKKDFDADSGDQTRSLYGAYSPDGQTIIAFGRNKYSTPFSLMVSHDGGKTWDNTDLRTELAVSHSITVLQSYNDPNVFLANEYRSTDGGYTWNKMDGCLAAFTINPTGKHEIYGGSPDGKPVVSYDDGATWKILCNDEKITKYWACYAGSERIQDAAYDHVNNILYVLDRFSTQYSADGKVNDGKCIVVKIPLDNPSARKDLDVKYYAGFSGIRSIAVDPNSTSVLYVAGSADACLNPTGLYRSIDGGETFTNLTYSVFTMEDGTLLSNKALNQGGYEANQVRVDPLTGNCIIGTNCYGFEYINPPYDPALLKR